MASAVLGHVLGRGRTTPEHAHARTGAQSDRNGERRGLMDEPCGQGGQEGLQDLCGSERRAHDEQQRQHNQHERGQTAQTVVTAECTGEGQTDEEQQNPFEYTDRSQPGKIGGQTGKQCACPEEIYDGQNQICNHLYRSPH